MRKGQRSNSIMYLVICGTNEYIDPLVFFVSLELCSVLGYSLKILHSLSIDEQKCSFFLIYKVQSKCSHLLSILPIKGMKIRSFGLTCSFELFSNTRVEFGLKKTCKEIET